MFDTVACEEWATGVKRNCKRDAVWELAKVERAAPALPSFLVGTQNTRVRPSFPQEWEH